MIKSHYLCKGKKQTILTLAENNVTQTYEPKVKCRFIVTVTNQEGELLIPIYVIKETSLPSFKYTWYGTKRFEILKLKLYNPIVPSSTTKVFDRLKTNKVNINISILGPIADKVEEWDIFNAKIQSVKFDPLNWSEEGEPSLISLEFKISDVKLLY